MNKVVIPAPALILARPVNIPFVTLQQSCGLPQSPPEHLRICPPAGTEPFRPGTSLWPTAPEPFSRPCSDLGSAITNPAYLFLPSRKYYIPKKIGNYYCLFLEQVKLYNRYEKFTGG
jgi:hypothetical protein